jgi:hypothetical protein
MNAIGKAKEKAKTKPQSSVRKLWAILRRNEGFCMETKKTWSTLENVGRLELGTRWA